MKNQNTLVEKEIRKEALKMTLSFTVSIVVIELLAFVLLQWIMTCIGNFVLADPLVICFSFILITIIYSIAGYFDFKKEITKIHENNNSNRTIG